MRVGGPEATPFALDFGTVMQMGAAVGCDMRLLADVLPAVSIIVIAAMNDDDGNFDDEEVT